MKHALSPVEHADAYRSYSAAIQLVSKTPMQDLKQKSRIVSYLYESGHVHHLILWKLPIEEFARAFDLSRAKGRTA